MNMGWLHSRELYLSIMLMMLLFMPLLAPSSSLSSSNKFASISFPQGQMMGMHEKQRKLWHHLLQSKSPLNLISTVADAHVWPELELNWHVVLGSILGFLGAAFGSIGGVGGGGIFVPVLCLIIGFDQKSSAALSKCMIMGASAATVWYNFSLKHPTQNTSLIDYDLALIFQPMLMLGISIGVHFNVVFPNWLVTILLIFLFTITSSMSFSKGVKFWKKETIQKRLKKENGFLMVPSEEGLGAGDYEAIDNEPNAIAVSSIWSLIKWKAIVSLIFVWICYLSLQILKSHSTECGVWYWIWDILQVSSATATFVMLFSSSMSVIEYYLISRFPVPFGLYLCGISILAGFWAQYFVRKLVMLLGRASILVFTLSMVIFISALLLGGSGIQDSIIRWQRHEYMGFLSLCT